MSASAERDALFAAAVRDACVREAIAGYERASISGLCAEGAFEAAVSALHMLDPATLAADAGAQPAPGRSGSQSASQRDGQSAGVPASQSTSPPASPSASDLGNGVPGTPEGLSHVTFMVSDLERSARLWREGLGAREVYSSGAHGFSVAPEKFFVLGGVWVALMQGEPARGAAQSYEHVAFKVDAADLPDYARRLGALGATPESGRARVDGEGESLYFRDHDGHRLELHTGTLDQRLACYAGLRP